jgi:hypothetical protein
LKNQPILRAHHRRGAERPQRAETRQAGLLEGPFGFLGAASQGEFEAGDFAVMAIDNGGQATPLSAGKHIGIVCHSTGALHHVKAPDGKLLVQGKEVTGFTNGEEEEVGLSKIVPFLVEDEMLKLGAVFSKVANWGVHVVSDGLLITGQNPHSSGPAAKTLMAAIK